MRMLRVLGVVTVSVAAGAVVMVPASASTDYIAQVPLVQDFRNGGIAGIGGLESLGTELGNGFGSLGTSLGSMSQGGGLPVVGSLGQATGGGLATPAAGPVPVIGSIG